MKVEGSFVIVAYLCAEICIFLCLAAILAAILESGIEMSTPVPPLLLYKQIYKTLQ